jgi:two-component system, NarL family, sensor kinase
MSGAPEHTPARESQRLSCLLEVARVINSSLELNAVLDRILSHATAILEAESGSIMLLDETSRKLRVLAARGPRAREIEGKQQELGQGVAGWVALHGEPVLLHGAVADPRFRLVCERHDLRDALSVPLQADERVIGVVNLSNRRSAEPFSQDDLELLTALANQAALAIRNARSFQEMRRQRRTVERLLDEVTRAQEEERMRIALQIHDGPAQTMFAALRNVEAAQALVGQSPPALAGVMAELERTIRQSIRETRAVMLDLKPPPLEGLGVRAALRQYVDDFAKRTGIETAFVYRGPEARLPQMMESCFYRITQEALANVWKHADAARAWVTLDVRQRSCALEIRDNGKGFDPEAAAATQAQHLGMRSLYERAELVGGRLTMGAVPGEGTVVRVEAPLAD